MNTDSGELALPAVDPLACAEVDLECQVLLNQAAQAESHTFACPWACDPSNQVIGVAGQTVPTWLLFPIQGSEA